MFVRKINKLKIYLYQTKKEKNRVRDNEEEATCLIKCDVYMMFI